jgi:hypothetical protein
MKPTMMNVALEAFGRSLHVGGQLPSSVRLVARSARLSCALLGIALLSACARRAEAPQPAADSAAGSVGDVGAADRDAVADAPGGALNGDVAPGATPGIGWRGMGTPGSTSVPNVILSPPTAPPSEATRSTAPTPGAVAIPAAPTGPPAAGALPKGARPTS